MMWKTTMIGLLAAGVAACAPRAAVDPVVVPENDALAIVIQHNVPVAGSISVRLFDPAGTWQHLGTVSPAQTETFVIEEDPVAGTYRLVAETTDGRRAMSRPFALTGRDGVRWNLFTNTVIPLDVEFVDEDEVLEGEPAVFQ